MRYNWCVDLLMTGFLACDRRVHGRWVGGSRSHWGVEESLCGVWGPLGVSALAVGPAMGTAAGLVSPPLGAADSPRVTEKNIAAGVTLILLI